MKELLKSIKNGISKKVIYKHWRMDKSLWEQQIKIFWFITYYKYSIFKDGKVDTHNKFRKYPNPKYATKALETKVYIGKKEFHEVYNGNKWTVPINYELNLDLP